MIYDFPDLMAAVRADEMGCCRISPGPAWRQGRTLYGGLTAAIAVRMAESARVSSHPLRSAQFAFTAAADESIESHIKPLASGRSSDFFQILCTSNGKVILNALLCFGAHRQTSASYSNLPVPDVPPPDACASFFTHPQVPFYTRQLDARLAHGEQLASKAERPDLALWLRHHAKGAADVASSVIALADALPPTTLLTVPSLIPVSSMTWHVDVLTETFSGSAWHLARSTAEHTDAGYSSQDMAMWSEDGNPVLRARQTIAVYS